MEVDYRWHRRWIVRITLVAITAVCVVYVANRSDVTTGATQADTSATPLPADIAVIDAQVDEISRSQDRFQQAVLGIVAFAGAGLVALIGFNFYATNRNVDRESAFLRDRAQMSAKEEADKARTTFEETLEHASRSLREQVDRHVENADDDLRRASKHETAEVRQQVQTIVEEHVQSFRNQRERLNEVAMGFHAKLAAAESRMASDRAALNQISAQTLWLVTRTLRRLAQNTDGDVADELWVEVFSHSLQLIEAAQTPGANSDYVGHALAHALQAVTSHSQQVNPRQWADYEGLVRVTTSLKKGPVRTQLKGLDDAFGEQRLLGS